MMRILALVLMLLVSACGLRPLYSGGGGGKVSQVLRSVDAPQTNPSGVIATGIEPSLPGRSEEVRLKLVGRGPEVTQVFFKVDISFH